jgi:D-alanyl-D-alanine carboxypeptidase/D-alanyl-D-alanine-endopeptidase (penicillin-binding protein 4)
MGRTGLGTLLMLLALACGAEALPPSVQRVMDGHGIGTGNVSLIVQQVGSDRPLLSHLPDEPRNPASAIKLLTTWAALDYLGPAYSWETQVYALGQLEKGVLDGDLLIKGSGDPYLVTEELWKLFSDLRRKGLREITGDLLIDDSDFAVPFEDPGAFDNQPFRPYNVAPNALLTNFKVVRFEFFPDEDGRVRITMDPALDNLTIKNRLRLAEGRCRGYQAGISFNIPDRQTGARPTFSGNFPSGCASYSMTRTVLQHHTYLHGLFRALWSQLGGSFDGRVRKDLAPEDIEPFFTWRSRPLAEVIRSVNKYSNNVMTRQLLYTLGAEDGGAPATAEAGIAAIRSRLEFHDLSPGSLQLDNGAGLSRNTRISARLLADVLLTAYGSPHMPEFLASLSLAGLDGTTRRRFRGRPEAGRLHIKTGRLDHVAAVAGYVHSAAGPTYVLVALINDRDVHRGPGEELQNALLRWAHGR